MKGFRRLWVRRASLARAIIGCCEPVQADTVRRARLIRARAAEVVGPVWARRTSAVRSWLGLGPGRCGLLRVGIRAFASSDARFLTACCFAVCCLASAVCDLDLSLVALRLRLMLRAVCGHTARLFPAVLSRSPSSLHPRRNRVPISTFLAENCGCERFKRGLKGSWQEPIVLTYF